MEFGQRQLEIFASLALILGAAFLALILDFLRGHHELLRELHLELKIRREEEKKRWELIAAQLPAAPFRRPMAEAKRPLAAEARAAMERGEQLAGAAWPEKPAKPV